MELIVFLLILAWAIYVCVSIIRWLTDEAVTLVSSIRDKKRAQRDAEAREREWREVTEPKLRSVSGYPEDWQTRRIETFLTANGRCSSCGTQVGSLRVSPEQRWHYPLLRLSGAQVHHKVPLSRGGDHSLDNLELLCDDCHIAHHPSNQGLKRIKRIRNIRSAYLGRDPDFKKARREWACAGCERSIRPGQEYYGGQHAKLCMSCFDEL